IFQNTAVQKLFEPGSIMKPFTMAAALRNDQPVVRRNAYDTTFVRGGGDYHPPYPMAGFTLINWKDESMPAEEFDKIK
ncbi:MAG: penicillin-binding transpeptidase domain-containing protein, partial [Candidatus Riflebacteria bacterium]|nr:penicillin-binding transpeptidase domain-containing protein [Candidatus Riflebacteria bacterium]